MTRNFYFPLDQTVLVVIPDRDGHAHIVQVTIRPTAEKSGSIDEQATFYLAQRDISECIEAILIADLDDVFPRRDCKWIDIRADNYHLRGYPAPWTHGDYLEFNWGHEELQKCRDKWMFEFELV